MAIVGNGIARIQLDRRACKRTLEIAYPVFLRSRSRVGIGGKRRDIDGASKIEMAFGTRVFDPDQTSRMSGLLESFGDDHSQRLMIMIDHRPAQQFDRIEIALAELAGGLRGHNPQHARSRTGITEVHRGNTPFGHGRTHDVAIDDPRHFPVVLICIRSCSGCLEWSVDTILGTTNDLHPVDGICPCRLLELHDIRPLPAR